MCTCANTTVQPPLLELCRHAKTTVLLPLGQTRNKIPAVQFYFMRHRKGFWNIEAKIEICPTTCVQNSESPTRTRLKRLSTNSTVTDSLGRFLNKTLHKLLMNCHVFYAYYYNFYLLCFWISTVNCNSNLSKYLKYFNFMCFHVNSILFIKVYTYLYRYLKG
jgi:hypothetical protein